SVRPRSVILPILAIRSPTMPTSPLNVGSPDPSAIVPLRMTRSNDIAPPRMRRHTATTSGLSALGLTRRARPDHESSRPARRSADDRNFLYNLTRHSAYAQ